jgi:DNA invertase Pin-like site-specific DNA recombinase
MSGRRPTAPQEANGQGNGSGRAVLYLRVSTKEQAEKNGEAEGYSIPAQRSACRRKAEALGAAVVEEFVDRGESARNARRPELQRMLVYVGENEVSHVIVHKVDRLARDRVDDVEITLALRTAGATLVSCSENIDETPSGILLHGIMSSIAEFYSRNLASEVLKGSLQKVRSGGSVGKAPLGYLNVRLIENGREVRTVEVDPVRGPQIKWAFETYASGEWGLRQLLDEGTRRGLDVPATATKPAKPLYLSHLHSLLKHPFYKGVVRYMKVEYPGRHEPLVSEETWDRVQQVLTAKGLAREKQHKHNHYLKGSVYCEKCKSRLIITNARSHSGKIYPYFVCIGRHQKRNDCTMKAVLIERVEELVEEHYRTIELKPELGEVLQKLLSEDLALYQKKAASERKTLERRRSRLLAERAKLLQAHYADAIPLELLKVEQDRIKAQLAKLEERTAATDQRHADTEANLKAALELAGDCHAAYSAAPHAVRRLFNQAFFKKIYVEEGDCVRSELASPFDLLLDNEVKARAAAIASEERPRDPVLVQAWKAMRNESTPEKRVLEGAGRLKQRFFRSAALGLNYEALVGSGGYEL